MLDWAKLKRTLRNCKDKIKFLAVDYSRRSTVWGHLWLSSIVDACIEVVKESCTNWFCHFHKRFLEKINNIRKILGIYRCIKIRMIESVNEILKRIKKAEKI